MPRMSVVHGHRSEPPTEQPSENEDEHQDREQRPRRTKRQPKRTMSPEASNEKQEKDDEEKDEKPKKRRKRRAPPLTTPKPSKSKKRREVSEEPESPPESEEKEKTPTPEHEPKVVMRLPTRAELDAYTPLQLLLDYLLRQLCRLDPEEFFTYPVTEEDAPDYFDIIKSPMDFMTMRQKMHENKYNCLNEFKADAELVVENAFRYNERDSIYYLAATKLKTIIENMFSLGSLAYLSRARPFMKFVTMDQLNLPADAFEVKAPEDNTKELLDSVRTDTRCLLAVLDEDKDNRETRLRVLTSAHVMTQEQASESKTARIYDLIPRLRQGNPGLLAQQNKFDTAVPVTMLDYGPYASFAPTYSSEHATLSLEDSIRLQRVYGSARNGEYASSLRSFVENTHDTLIKRVDGLLDAVTGGRHTKLIDEIMEECGKKVAETPKETIDINALRTLANDGIDVSFLDNIETELTSDTKSTPAKRLLDQNAASLRQLATTQEKRLSQQPPFTVTHREMCPVSQQEHGAASSVVQNLVTLVRDYGAHPTSSDLDVLQELLN